MWDVGAGEGGAGEGGAAGVVEAVTYRTAMGAAMITDVEGSPQARPPTGSTIDRLDHRQARPPVVGKRRNHVSRETWFRGAG